MNQWEQLRLVMFYLCNHYIAMRQYFILDLEKFCTITTTWFNKQLLLQNIMSVLFNVVNRRKPKPGLQSMALCGAVGALSIATVLY